MSWRRWYRCVGVVHVEPGRSPDKKRAEAVETPARRSDILTDRLCVQQLELDLHAHPDEPALADRPDVAEKRERWKQEQGGFDTDRLFFIDETWA